MTIFRDISANFDKHLLEMVGLPVVAWENANYEPVIGTLFIRPTNLQGETVQTGLGDNGNDETLGIYQVDVFTDSNTGKGPALSMADTIADHFKRGTSIDYNSVNVRILSVSRSAGSNSNGWYNVPVLIKYFSITQART